MTSSQDNNEEKTPESVAASVEPAEQKNNTNTEMRQLMSHVRQNFGKINVAPEFSEEDLVPVDVPGFDETDSDSAGEEEQEEEKEENEPHQDSVAEELELAVPGARESSKTVLKALEEKIAKYKKFLDKAKAKRFSAIRYLNLFGGSGIPQQGNRANVALLPFPSIPGLCDWFLCVATHELPQLTYLSHRYLNFG